MRAARQGSPSRSTTCWATWCPGEPAWALLHERLALLVHRCAEVTDTHGGLEAVRRVQDRAATIAATIGAHVPADLRPAPSADST
jgi:hypothetical protein